jgi:hypothetical protein
LTERPVVDDYGTSMNRPIYILTADSVPDLMSYDREAIRRLKEKGIEAHILIWDRIETSKLREIAQENGLVLIRCCWGYYLKHEQFRNLMLDLRDNGIEVHNPVETVLWNMHKSYLLDLEKAGITIVPTELRPQGSSVDLAAIAGRTGWKEMIVKPAISASSYETHLISGSFSEAQNAKVRDLVRRGDVLVQKFMKSVLAEGEWSMICLGDGYSFSVLKKPKPGDFRALEEFGGKYKVMKPSAVMVNASRRIKAVVEKNPLYMRIDGVMDGGRFHIMELELIEPHLFMDIHEEGIGHFVDSLLATMDEG